MRFIWGRAQRRETLVSCGNIYGSYVHGLFDADGIADGIIEALCGKKGIQFDTDAVFDGKAYKETQYNLLADAVRGALDMKLIYDILERKI